MEQTEDVCPVCGINDNDLKSHLSTHSKDEIITAYSCQAESSVPTPSTNCANGVANASGIACNIKQAPNAAFTSASNAYNTVYIPVNHPNYPMQPLPQPAFSIDMQQKAQSGSNLQVPNFLQMQNPMIYMPQYSNIIAPNMPTYPHLLKGDNNPSNVAPPQPVNVMDQSFAVNNSPKVGHQQPNYVSNPGFPNMQQNPYQAMPMFPFYQPTCVPPGMPNFSFCGNSIYAPSPVPTVVQFPASNTVAPVNAAGFVPVKMQTIASKPINQSGSIPHPSQVNEVANDTANKLQGTSVPETPQKQCYYVGDKEALVSIGDDVKLILPKEILGNEELLGEFLREQLATAIASEVKSEAVPTVETTDQTVGLEASNSPPPPPPDCNWATYQNENSLSPINTDFIKPMKLEEQPADIVKRAHVSPIKHKSEVFPDSNPDDTKSCIQYSKNGDFGVLDGQACLEVLEDEHQLVSVEEILPAEGQSIKQCFIVKSENDPDSGDDQKPRVIKMFSKNCTTTDNASKFDEDDFLGERDIKCISQCPDEIFTEHNGSLVESDVNLFDVIDGGHSVSFKSENEDVCHPEEKLSLKSSETLGHSDSESPCFMENTLQDLICIDEPGIQTMSSPKKISCSEFRMSSSRDQEQLHFTLDKDNSLVMVSSSFMQNFLSPIKGETTTVEQDDSVLFSNEKITKVEEPFMEDGPAFLEPFASTSGIPSKHSAAVAALNKSLEQQQQEEYDFDYESDYFDSDSDLSPSSSSRKRALRFQWECGTCRKSFKSLKEKLLHSGCHADESVRAADKDSPVATKQQQAATTPSPVKLEHLVEEDCDSPQEEEHLLPAACDSKRGIQDDVLNRRIELLRNPLSCSLCFSLFPNQLSVTQHQKTHALAELKCTTCSKQIRSFSLWTEHQLFHYGASRHECKYCGRKFERRPLLNVHVRKHTGQRPFKCVTCGSKFAVRGSLKAHTLTHLKDQKAECEQCGKTFKNHACMLRHRSKYHTHKKQQTTFKRKQDHLCATCHEVFPSERKLRWHREIHQRWPSKCRDCGECFVHQSGLTKHIRLKHNAKHVPAGQSKGVSVPCVVCRKMYTASSLVLHMRTHNGYKPFKCIVCSKQFSVKCNLTNHMWTHAGTKERPFRCSLCERSYSRRKFLEAHVRAHRKIKPYTCNECGKPFAYKHNLTAHLKQHFGEKEHLCSYCGKAFFRKYNLKDHVRVHTGETPFSCTICNKEFTQKSNYNVHIKAFHVERHVLDEEI